MSEIVNIASELKVMAERFPHKEALILCSSGKRLSFSELNSESDRFAHGLRESGVGPGTLTALLVPPGEEFFVLAFALFKVGAVMVLIDPGMGVKNLLRCLEEIKPTVFIGTSRAMALKTLTRSLKSVKVCVTLGPKLFWGGLSLKNLRSPNPSPFEITATKSEDSAAVLFTTGSTGLAKGVLYKHGMFRAQVKTLKELYAIGDDEIDLPTFPLFALFDPALGMTAVIPDMDPRRPGFVNPLKITGPIHKFQVTHMFGSPALLDRVGRYGQSHGIKLPTLRRVISAGAPVSPGVLARFSSMLNANAEIHTPYGATEALPVATIASSEILKSTSTQTDLGAGTCVGRPAGDIAVRVIKITDTAISNWNSDLLAPQGTVGEIVVRGSVVTHEYFARDQATQLAKIQEGSKVWHRMGDLGSFDSEGRLWFFGRKSQRVITPSQTLFTDPVEGIMNTHAQVARTALVGVGDPGSQRAVLCVEVLPEVKASELQRIAFELRALADRHTITQKISEILFHPKFPVDIRHNAKIFREKLAVWASKKLPQAHEAQR